MPKLLVGDVLKAAAEKFPSKTAFVFKDERLSYSSFENRVNRLANGLLEKGYIPGDHVAILAYNCIQYYEILFALAKVGMVAVPVNFRLTGPEISHVIQQSDAKGMIYQANFRDTVQGVRPKTEGLQQLGWFVFGSEGDSNDTGYEELIACSSSRDPEVNVDENAPWYIGYTGGTTGHPKGALRSHRCNVLLAANTIYLNEDDIMLLIMPIFHTNSIWFGIRCVYRGMTIVIYPSTGFDPGEILEIIQREHVTFSSMVPTMYTMILQMPDKQKYDIGSVKKLLTSSAPLMSKTKEQILHFFQNAELYESYGSTESGSVTTLLPKDQYRKVRSCGRPSAMTKIRILNSEGNECPPGEIGELYMVGPGMFEGYYKNPEANRKAFRGEYLSVGDMAKVDEEGYYYIVDRRHDMIISGGENIYPSEIDDLLTRHPKILQAAVIGVPDDKWGEAVTAEIILREESTMTEKEVMDYCKQHLAGYKCPKKVVFVDSFPLSPTGKILKRGVRKKYWERFETII